mmetsp:Transcript_46476/g.104994  ORF Transcript_46476/g.104994 Transcript_46476/m.104994 type:complete len:749 (+) Transcript_46476:235-2481(+)
MSKEAIVFCIDVGSSMAGRLTSALEGVKLLIEAKILQSKQNEIGVVLFGTDDTANPLASAGTGYEHVTVLADLVRPQVALLSTLDTQIETGSDAADLIDGLVVSVDLIVRRIGKKKYLKTVYLITAAEDPIENPDDLDATVQHMIDQEVNLVVVGIDFKHTTSGASDGGAQVIKEEDQDAGEEDEEEASVKEGNERMLLSIVRATKLGAVLSSSDLVETLNRLQTRTVQPPKNKVQLVFPGEGHEEVPVLVYARAKRTTMPSLKKEAKAAYDPTAAEPTGGVKTDRVYRNPNQPDEEVGAQDLVKGYRYGREYVPVSAADGASMKVETPNACLRLIAFADASAVRASDSIGDVKCVVPAVGSRRSEACVASLASAMRGQGRVAIARFVARRNADPQLVCVFPSADPPRPGHQDHLLMWQLPFADDIRGFTFPSFAAAPASQQPSREQVAACGAVVDSLMLDGAAFMPEATFNPVIQRNRKLVIARVLDPNCQLPGVDPRVRAYMEPSPALAAQAQPALGAFAALFKMTPVEDSGGKAKRKHFWSDIAGADDEAASTAAAAAGGADEAPASSSPSSPSAAAAVGGAAGVSGKRSKPGGPVSIGSVSPVADFEALLGDPQVVPDAINAMMARIVSLVELGGTSAHYRKAIEGVASLRRACLNHGEAQAFNDWIGPNFKDSFESGMHGEAFELLVAANLSLISSDEDDAADVSPDDARAFLAPPDTAASAAPGGDSALPETEDDGDLDDME